MVEFWLAWDVGFVGFIHGEQERLAGLFGFGAPGFHAGILSQSSNIPEWFVVQLRRVEKAQPSPTLSSRKAFELMRQLLIAAFEEAVTRFKAEEALMPLARWNESVFRFLYSRVIAAKEPDVTQLVECNRIDLMLHRRTERAFVEFKFYTHSVGYNPVTGMMERMKGYPSSQNRREFENCVKILRERTVSPEVLKLVVLFYADPVAATRNKNTYEMSYGNDSGIENELKIRLLTSIGPFQSNDSKNVCNAKLYEVRS